MIFMIVYDIFYDIIYFMIVYDKMFMIFYITVNAVSDTFEN